MPERPVAPPLDALDGPAYQFVILSSRESMAAVPVGEGVSLVGPVTHDLSCIDTRDFFQRGGPVCWAHEWSYIVGRTLKVWREGAVLLATMRFQSPACASTLKGNMIRSLRQSLDHGSGFKASVSLTPLNELIEWSITTQAGNPDARFVKTILEPQATPRSGSEEE